MKILFCISEVKGYEKLWFLGDEFISKTHGPYFQDNYDFKDLDYFKDSYIRNHFDTAIYCDGSLTLSMKNRNVIGRIFNNIVCAINKDIILPKIIVLVMEDDLIKSSNHYTDGISTLLGQQCEWLANEIHRTISGYKEKLPTKARKFRYPHILWIGAVHHTDFGGKKNYFRKKFNTCALSVTELFREMDFLMLNTWDSHDKSLVTDSELNASGKEKYWQAVDNAVQKWDRDQMNMKSKAQFKKGFKPNAGKLGGNVKYHTIKT